MEKSIVSLLHKNFLDASFMKLGLFMTENLHPEFLFTSPKAIVLGKEAYTNDFVMNADVHLEVFEIVEGEVVTICGTTAVLSGVGRAKFKGKDEFFVRITSTLIYDETHWKLLAVHETFIP